ncbi:siphovirus Gp157 family protein [Nitratiruptor tergarcus]|uniref:Uncharacterized protein n=1 Tax=Nitratiruptor tergarcus DSM 16512 TaxID=1069081 RepID=A0A1W1WUT0_9BACT|nr:siphovirus Gp157 family protein [Nitratiruptor tergarcus]SMC10078.1 hypothetical protein SAMN05660197_1914 [Nitratiruptor tergarcus DSM 16512]
MKTTNYRLQTEIEHLTSPSKKEWFKNYLKEILESDKPYYVKCDYIALSFLELDNKIAYLSSEIKILTELKKKLQQAKTLGLEIAAEILQEYGIDKIEGTAISSFTITPPRKNIKTDIRIKDPQKVMELGYVKFDVDKKAIEKALQFPELFEELEPYVDVEYIEEDVPARLKINKKRNSVNSADTVEIINAA